MPNDVNLRDVSPEFEGKVFTIADEVLKILKELSLENKTEINSTQIAERMFWKDSLKDLLNDIHAITEDEGLEIERRRELSGLILGKFTELIPAYMASKLGDLKDDLHNKNKDGDSKEWIDSPIEVVKVYIDSISARNNDLEVFLNDTMDHIIDSEESMSSELSFQQQRFNDDIAFENRISSDIEALEKDISGAEHLSDVKMIIMSSLEEINHSIELKRKQDMQQAYSVPGYYLLPDHSFACNRQC